MQTAIAAAVEPLRTAAMERAREAAAKLVETAFAKHAADPKFHDYPRSIWGKAEHAMQKARYTRFQSLTTNGARDEVKVARFIADAVERAGLQYTAFIEKLEAKIGEHTAASLAGSHVWGYSILTVTKANGSTEKWKTQQIINVSPLGLPFNQWPTRKVR